MPRRTDRAGAAPSALTDTSTGERQADDASPATSPAAPRSTPTPPEATAGSLPRETPDQHTSAAGETTGAEAPLTRAAIPTSRDPSTAPGAAPTRSAQGHREPSDTQTTTATDPPRRTAPRSRTYRRSRPWFDAGEFLNPTRPTYQHGTRDEYGPGNSSHAVKRESRAQAGPVDGWAQD